MIELRGIRGMYSNIKKSDVEFNIGFIIYAKIKILVFCISMNSKIHEISAKN
jgi:hypothetical protein